jgi:hypothetical protein
MSGSTSAPVTTQTQTRDPWSGAQGYLSQMYSTAQAMQQGGTGYLPYTGATVAPMDPQLQTALAGQYGLGVNQLQTLIPSMNQAQDLGNMVMANQGVTPNIAGALGPIQSAIGQYPGYIQGLGNIIGGIPEQQRQLASIAGQMPATYAGLGNMIGYAANTAGGLAATGQQYQDIYARNVGANNPYLQAEIDAQNRLAINKIQGTMSAAGRYGSGQYDDVMARAQAEVADPILAQDYAQRQQTQLQATQGLGNVYGQMGNLYQGLGGMYANMQGMMGNEMNAINQINALGNQQRAQLIAQQAGLTGQGAQLGGGLADIYNRGLAMAGQYAGQIPGYAQAQYAPYQQMANVGAYAQGRAQQDLQGQIALYNAQQAWPWQQLERESAILAGAGQLGGTTVTAQTPLQASLPQRLLGGALVGGGLGSTIGGPLGAGLGALGGAGIGAFL